MRRTPGRRSARGFTLTELMVAGAITIIAVGMLFATFLSQSYTMASLDLSRGAQESFRDSTLQLEQNLRRIGWGIEPRLALDFNVYSCASSTSCPRDSISAPDELVFYARNPNYRWRAQDEAGCTTVGGCYEGRAWRVTGTNPVKLEARVGDTFEKGRIVQFSCANGRSITFGTVASRARATAAGDLQITLTSVVAADPFQQNNFVSCYSEAGASAFQVDRSRYMVKSYDLETYGPTPHLMLDTGLDLDDDGSLPATDADDVLPVAPGVEDFQVAYVLNNMSGAGFVGPDSNRNWVIGDQQGVAEQPNPALTAPVYDTALVSATRANLHPGNVRSIRVSMVLRSLRQDQAQPNSWTGDPFRLFENRSVPPPMSSAASDAQNRRRRRFGASMSITLRDMESRSSFIF